MAYGITKIYFFLFFSLLCNDLLAVNTDSFMRLSLENEILVEIGERAGKAPSREHDRKKACEFLQKNSGNFLHS